MRAAGTRWLGIGLAAVLATVTLGLGVTGRLTLYVSPDSVWYVCLGAVVTLVGAVWSFVLPLGAEEDHTHDHSAEKRGVSSGLAMAGTVTAGVVASGVAVAALVLPPASLSVELAMSRAETQATLFAGADTPTLGVADTTTFGVGEWAAVFATATRPESYEGSAVTLTGFMTPDGDDPDAVNLTRLVITHCVIDAQTATVPLTIDSWAGEYTKGEWVEVSGTVAASDDGTLRIVPTSVVAIDEPGDPYEY